MSPVRIAGIAFVLSLLAATGVAGASQADNKVATGPLDLSTAWRLTRMHYPRYLAAVSEREAGQTNRALGRAGMLPHISAQFGLDQNWGEMTEPGARGREVTTDLDYDSWENRVQLSQTLFDWAKINDWRQGDAKADRSQAVFHNATRDIAMELVNRYLQLLLAQQDVILAEKNLQADERHIEIARQLYQGGAGTITDVQAATARRARSYAELQNAKAALTIAWRRLRAMTGQSSRQRIQGLAPGFEPGSLQPETLAAWIARAQENNAGIRVARYDLRIAEREIDKAVGQMLPSVGLSASYSRSHSSSISLLNVDSRTTAVGVNVQVPIFAGGGNWARINQTQYKYQKTRQGLAATREQVAVEVTRQYLGSVTGAEHIRALEKAVSTAELALEAVRTSYKAGTRSINDILQAQEQLHKVRRELARARLSYVKARIKLKVVAGFLDAEAIVATADEWFGPESTDPS